MDAQLQIAPVPSHPADFFDPASFVRARLEAWRAVSGIIDPGDEILPVLKSVWITAMGPAPSVLRALALIDRTSGIDLALLDVNLGDEGVYPLADALAARGVPFLLNFCSDHSGADFPG